MWLWLLLLLLLQEAEPRERSGAARPIDFKDEPPERCELIGQLGRLSFELCAARLHDLQPALFFALLVLHGLAMALCCDAVDFTGARKFLGCELGHEFALADALALLLR